MSAEHDTYGDDGWRGWNADYDDLPDDLPVEPSSDEILSVFRDDDGGEDQPGPPAADSSVPTIVVPEGQTDLSNARRLIELYGERIRFCHPWRKWLIWDSHRWAVDADGAVERMAKSVADWIWRTANTLDDAAARRWAAKSAGKYGVDAMLALATSEVPISPDDMDGNEWLLNCPNGTVDLRTGEIRPHRKEDNITQLCPVEYDPNATAPTWEKFQRDVCNGDEELLAFKRRLMGYCLTGDVREQILPIAWGTGSNGKSTEIDALADTLGADYTGTLPRSLLMVSRQERHPTELTTLFRKRLMFAHETDDGGRLSEALVKQLTGGDSITCRGMRQDFWTFLPTHKILLATNHKPDVRGTDHAIWRRLRLIPYTVKFDGERRDKSMPEKLADERPGILAWLVRGCREWQASGLAEPETVAAATREYRDAQDVLAAFLEDCCIISPSCRVKAGQLYAAYKDWTDRTGEYTQTQRKFGDAMTEREFKREHSGGTWYIGIGLLNE
jgi:putative DNA primase/helicase